MSKSSRSHYFVIINIFSFVFISICIYKKLHIYTYFFFSFYSNLGSLLLALATLEITCYRNGLAHGFSNDWTLYCTDYF